MSLIRQYKISLLGINIPEIDCAFKYLDNVFDNLIIKKNKKRYQYNNFYFFNKKMIFAYDAEFKSICLRGDFISDFKNMFLEIDLEKSDLKEFFKFYIKTKFKLDIEFVSIFRDRYSLEVDSFFENER